MPSLAPLSKLQRRDLEANLPKSPFILCLGVLAAATAARANQASRPLFARNAGLRPNIVRQTALPTWNFSWTYNGQQYNAVFVGANPAGGAPTTIPSYIIPVALKYGTTLENPLAKDKSGKSVVDYTLTSPIFQSGIDFVLGQTDIGATQYTDAFQRGALWGAGVQANPGYHVLLGTPTVEKLVTLDSPAADGTVGTQFGVKVVEADINWFDQQIQKQLTRLKIPANSLPIFLTTQAYLLQDTSCCIGGYHSYNGAQTYVQATFIQGKQAFAEDVSALSHELAGWMDNPLSQNMTPCGGYDVGGGGNAKHPFGTYAYKLNGFTYHLQDLLFPPYFGAPASTSVNGWLSFHNNPLSVCSKTG
jgi:hypothetical protein